MAFRTSIRISSLGLRPRFQSPRPLLPNVGKPPYLNLFQGRFSSRFRVHRASRPLPTNLLPTTAYITQLIRPFVSSPLREQKEVIPPSESEVGSKEWDNPSNERVLRCELEGNTEKWGLVVFRSTYKPELARHWESFKRVLDEHTRRDAAESDATEIAERLEWGFIEDLALEGASRDELRQRFRQWARADNPAIPADYPANPAYKYRPPPHPSNRRHAFFLQVDEASLRSLLVGPDPIVPAVKDHLPNKDRPILDPNHPTTHISLYNGGWVNLVQGWWEPPSPEEEAELELEEEQKKDDAWTESWMMVDANMMRACFYFELEHGDSVNWFIFYNEPPWVVNQ